MMNTKDQTDQFAAELVRRFEDLTRWAIDNWPKPGNPLQESDFTQSRKEFSAIVGPKLGYGNGATDDGEAITVAGSRGNQADKRQDSAPYIETTPMPWP